MNKLIGEINGIKVYSNKKVPKDEVWVANSHRPNPVYTGGLLETLAFTDKWFYVRGLRMFKKLEKLTTKGEEQNT